MGDSKAPGRSLSESTGLRPHAANVKMTGNFRDLRERVEATCKSVLWLSWYDEIATREIKMSSQSLRRIHSLGRSVAGAMSEGVIRPRNVL